MSHFRRTGTSTALVLDYPLEYNMMLQRYFEPEFTGKGGFLRPAIRAKYADRLIEQYDVRSGQGAVTIGEKHVRRQPAESHRRQRARQEA